MIEHVFETASYALRPSAVPTLATAEMMLLLAAMVLGRERTSPVSRVFCLIPLTVCVWLACFSMMYCAVRADVALWWARAAYAGIPFIAAAIYHFSVIATGARERRRALVAAAWGLSAACSAVFLLSDVFLAGVYRYSWGFYPRYRWPSVLYLGIFFGVLGLGLREHWRGYRRAEPGTARLRSGSYVLAFSIASLACIDYLPAFGVPLYPFGYVPVLLFVVIAGRTIGRYRLTDITPSLAAHQIIATMADPLIVCDAESRIRLVNEATSRVFGYAERELLGRPLGVLAQERPDSGPRLREALETAEARDLEMALLNRAGDRIPVSVSISHLKNPDSSRAGTVVIARDIHERQRSEESLRQSEARFRSLAETSAAAVFIFEGERVRYVNPALESITGYSADELLARPLSELALPEHGEMLRQRAASLGPGASPSRFELKIATRRGPHRWVDVTLAPVEIDGLTWAMATAFDVTDHKLAEDAVRESERRLRDMLETVRLASLLLDSEGNVTFCNDYLLELLGLEQEQILGRNWFEQCLPPEQREAALARFREEMAAGAPSPHQEGTVLTTHGERRLLAWSSTLLKDLEGRPVGTASLGVDMTEQKRAESKLLHDAMHDALTGLPNRALFMDRLGGAMARAKRRPAYQFAVVFLDVDRFKVVNDSLGHLMGDQLLVEIGRRLEGCLRPGDTVARLGGDEFTVLLDDMADTQVPARVAERIQAALNAPFQVAGREVFVTVSMGIAQNKARYQHPEDFLRDADTAMYHAKATGKARHQEFDTAMHAKAMGLLQIENDLRKAVERGELRLYYQPFLSLRTGAIAGFEALVRWQHPQRGLVPPGDFIRVAEETGLILPLGSWVLGEACRQLRAWDAHLPDESLVMSVNLSGKQFSQPDLRREVSRVLEGTGIVPRRLKLEITESVLMEDPDAAAATLAALRAEGTQVCIDDFGTGYSSLSYLLRFPADTLKIDRSFVNDLSAGTQHWELVRTILALARNLGMDVIAEGVENDEQLARLDALECDYVQGYHLSRPVDAETAARLLTTEPLRLPSRLRAS